MTPHLTMTAIAHHRNGIDGAPFYVVAFCEHRVRMVGVVFEAPGHVAVFEQGPLAQGVIGFGVNSWRGDVYEPALRQAIADWEAQQEATP